MLTVVHNIQVDTNVLESNISIDSNVVDINTSFDTNVLQRDVIIVGTIVSNSVALFANSLNVNVTLTEPTITYIPLVVPLLADSLYIGSTLSQPTIIEVDTLLNRATYPLATNSVESTNLIESANGTNSGITFDGTSAYFNSSTSDILLANNTAFNFANLDGTDTPFSIELDFTLDSLTPTQTWFVAKAITTSSREWLVGLTSSLFLQFYLFNSDNSARLLTIADASSLITAIDTFHTLKVEYDGSKTNAGMSIILDGNVLATSTNNTGVYVGQTATTSQVVLGNITTSSNNSFRGKMKNLSIKAESPNVGGLLHYWQLQADANDSFGTKHGTPTDVTYTAGKFGNASTYNGSTSKVALASNIFQFAPSEATVSGYFRTNDLVNLQRFFGFNNSGSASPFMAVGVNEEATAGSIKAWIYTNSGVNLTVTNTSGTNWIHVIITAKEGGVSRMYINGVLAIEGSNSIFFKIGTNGNHIGSNRAGTLLNLDGQIQGFGLWNRFVTPEAVTQLFEYQELDNNLV